jgi:hypothetical protein
MSKTSPHILATTTIGCLIVVAVIAAAALSDSIIVAAVAFLATLAIAGLLVEMTVVATSGSGDGREFRDELENPAPSEASVR